MIYSLLNKDLPELDIITNHYNGRIDLKLSTEFSCAGDACLVTSDLLFNAPYALTGGIIARNAARNAALAQCTAGTGFETAIFVCF